MRVRLRGGCDESSALLQSAACDDLQSVFWILSDVSLCSFPDDVPSLLSLGLGRDDGINQKPRLGWAAARREGGGEA